jgi:N-acyl-phosphatidylethanolamine-hydrolysing phospholipase D
MLPRALLITLVTLAFVASVSATPKPDTLGPAPLDEDGRFTNSAQELGHGSLSTRLPFFWRRITGSFRDRTGAPEVLGNDGVFLRENATHSEPTVTWVGHSTLLVQMDHVTFLTDPIWSATPSPVSFAGPRRFVPPGIAIEDLPPIDFVVISHNHYDHLDLPTLVALAERDPDTRFFVPLNNGPLLRDNGIENVMELDWGSSVDHEGTRIYCLPAQHWSKRGLSDDRVALWSSWAVIGAERRFYFAGDTGYFDGFENIADAIGPFDLAAVPIGAYEPVEMMKSSHMNPEEAVQAAIDLQATRALAMHYGTFDLSDEPLDEPPRRFKDAAAQTRLGTDEAWLLAIGETRAF